MLNNNPNAPEVSSLFHAGTGYKWEEVLQKAISLEIRLNEWKKIAELGKTVFNSFEIESVDSRRVVLNKESFDKGAEFITAFHALLKKENNK